VLVIDDNLTFRALSNDYRWLPAGSDPAEIFTTTEWHFRLLVAFLRLEPKGVHSRAFFSLGEADRHQILARAMTPAPIVRLLDPRLSLNTAAAVRSNIGRFGYVLSDAVASAVVHGAELAVTIVTDNLAAVCDKYSVVLHHVLH
jgi:hypothetical protein